MNRIDTYNDQRIVLELYFKTNWNQQTTILFPNTRQKIPTDSKPWVRFQIIDSGTSSQMSMGPNCDVRYFGSVNVGVFVPKGASLVEAYKLSDTVLSMFSLVQLGQIQFRSGTVTTVGEFEENFQLSVIIPFYRNSLK